MKEEIRKEILEEIRVIHRKYKKEDQMLSLKAVNGKWETAPSDSYRAKELDDIVDDFALISYRLCKAGFAETDFIFMLFRFLFDTVMDKWAPDWDKEDREEILGVGLGG